MTMSPQLGDRSVKVSLQPSKGMDGGHIFTLPPKPHLQKLDEQDLSVYQGESQRKLESGKVLRDDVESQTPLSQSGWPFEEQRTGLFDSI
jgi:hypothetical protein